MGRSPSVRSHLRIRLCNERMRGNETAFRTACRRGAKIISAAGTFDRLRIFVSRCTADDVDARQERRDQRYRPPADADPPAADDAASPAERLPAIFDADDFQRTIAPRIRK